MQSVPFILSIPNACNSDFFLSEKNSTFVPKTMTLSLLPLPLNISYTLVGLYSQSALWKGNFRKLSYLAANSNVKSLFKRHIFHVSGPPGSLELISLLFLLFWFVFANSITALFFRIVVLEPECVYICSL